jgi:hypothetical protein
MLIYRTKKVTKPAPLTGSTVEEYINRTGGKFPGIKLDEFFVAKFFSACLVLNEYQSQGDPV